jgi:galactosamine-6-phosphate isomerase
MRFQIEADHEAMSRCAADLILEELEKTPDLVLVAASGATPRRTYELVASSDRAKIGSSAGSPIRVVKLDEWLGLAPDDPATCDRDLLTCLLQPLKIPPHNYLGFQSDPDDPEQECTRIREALAAIGRIDLCVLGIGTNGHLGFNEPGDSLPAFAHVAELSATSLRHGMLQAARSQPRGGLTLGMAEILSARRILLLASGPHKRAPIQTLASARLSTQFPASFLWLHDDVWCILDREAAGSMADRKNPREAGLTIPAPGCLR